MTDAITRLTTALTENGHALPEHATVPVRVGDLRQLLQLCSKPRSEARLAHLTHLLATQGHFNRSDLTRHFEISAGQAAIDTARWIQQNPEAARYNLKTKRYERHMPVLDRLRSAD